MVVLPDPLLGDAPEHLADLGEGVHGGRRRDHRKRADPRNASSRRPRTPRRLKSAPAPASRPFEGWDASTFNSLVRRAQGPFRRPYSLAAPTLLEHAAAVRVSSIQYRALKRDVALPIEADRAQHRVELVLP
jgi:hypothetical protein